MFESMLASIISKTRVIEMQQQGFRSNRLSALTCVPTAYFRLDICILQLHMVVTLKNPFFEEKYEIRVYASMVKRNAINMNVVCNFIQGRSCKLSSQATPADDPQQATPSVTQRACRLRRNAEARAVVRLDSRRPFTR
jgi:hypothetical protein